MGTSENKLVIKNIGMILSGKLEQPILDGDCIVCMDGKISDIGYEKDLDTDQPNQVVDANGVTISPGLIDSHIHPVVGDYTPRQQQLHWIDSTLNGGVTTLISAGEVHMPGRPKDIVGLKAMAIAAQRWYENFRPSGVKVLAGAPVIEHGMEEEDFKQLSDAGVKLLGEVGLGSVKDGPTAKKMVQWARKYGMQSTIHTGGPSIPGSGLIDKDVVLEADTDVIGHINGGHSALPDDQIICLCESCQRSLEIVHNDDGAGHLARRRALPEAPRLTGQDRGPGHRRLRPRQAQRREPPRPARNHRGPTWGALEHRHQPAPRREVACRGRRPDAGRCHPRPPRAQRLPPQLERRIDAQITPTVDPTRSLRFIIQHPRRFAPTSPSLTFFA